MGLKMNTYRRTGTTVPRVQEIQYEPGQTFDRCAIVVLNANGNVVECGANPAKVTGIALNAVATKPGFDVANATETLVYTGTEPKVSVALADYEQEFYGRGVNGATDPAVPLQANIGQQYGVLKTAGGDWVINLADQVNVVVQISDIKIDTGTAPRSLFVFRFIPSKTTLS